MRQGGNDNCDMHLHAEVEVLKQALVDKQTQLIAMETACLRESDRQVELEDSIIAWQDKYDRLYESHKRVQKVNQTLEDKLLKLVDRNSGERAQLTSDVATLSVRLAQANYNIAKLQHEIERYKTDINLAIQLLQCKPDSFVPQKVSSLPVEIQSKVSTYMRLETNSHSDSEGSTSGVGLATSGSYKVLPASDSPPPLCPFPPTAMVYSMRGLDARNNSDCNSNGDQMISPSAMAKYLQDELKASEIKHCDTCNCSPKDLTVLIDDPKIYSVGTQTIVQSESGNSLCLRCNSNLNSPSRTNSPYIMKIVKSSDSVISETKSSVSDLLDNEKLFTPAKKDDLMVDPILGHHRLCDRTVSKQQQQQISDTAKYIVETRKLENEIADLRKFNNKSPNLSLGAELCSTFSRNLTGVNEVKLCDIDGSLSESGIGQNGSATLLPETIVENEADLDTVNADAQEEHQEQDQEQEQDTCTSPKSNASGGNSDNKSEEKLQPDANSSRDSNDKNINNNMGTTITGSTNSLWSKSSSSEGAKLFENFNRNLIKTIKAENPLHRGPRLCALRIQNGSNNILLDNIDSDVTPIVYTRPSRFLDEELDDTKDIITSKISMLVSKQNTGVSSTSSQINSPSGFKPSTASIHQEPPNSGLLITATESESILASSAANFSVNSTTQINTSTDNYSDAILTMQNATSVDLSLDQQGSMHSPFQQQKNQLCSILDISEPVLGNGDCKPSTNNEVARNHSTCSANFEVSINPAIYASLCPDQHQHWNGFVVDVHQNSQSKPHCDIIMLAGDNSLNSSFKNTTTKSGTQSSSVSSSGLEIDVEESALLRRQQLTRVAEWVQNNSQQQQHIHLTGSTKQCCAQAPGSNHNHSITTQSSLSRNSNNSVESTNYTAIKQIPMSKQLSTLNNNFHYYHNNSQLQHLQLTSAPKDFKITTNDRHNSSDAIAQNNLYSLNQNLSVKPKHASIQSVHQASLMQSCNNVNQEKQQHVDLAQMEYNVKQFLLKQNEWSIRNVSNLSNSSSNTQDASKSATSPERNVSVDNGNIAGNSITSNLGKHTSVKNLLLPFRTETNFNRCVPLSHLFRELVRVDSIENNNNPAPEVTLLTLTQHLIEMQKTQLT